MYVERAVERARRLAPELVALTGDMVGGPGERLAPHVAPLAALAESGRAFVVLGNHDCIPRTRCARRESTACPLLQTDSQRHLTGR